MSRLDREHAPRAKVKSRRPCGDCPQGSAHCHDTLLLHADGTLECLGEAPCANVYEEHPDVVDCVQLDPPCGCAKH